MLGLEGSLLMDLSGTSIFHLDLNILIVFGLALFGGTVGGRFFQKMRIPQVVGYIIIGLVLGQSGIRLIDARMVQTVQPFSYFALGLIGFMIGGELNRAAFAKYGRQFMTILLFEGIFSFVMVTILIGVIGTWLLGDATQAWSLALLLGAISSATAPASTTDVLWENKSRGPLTTTIFGIVALDDVLAIALFAIASSCAAGILGTTGAGFRESLFHPLYEVGGAVALGGVAGGALVLIINHYRQKERIFVFVVGMVLFVLGLSIALKVSMLLAAMVMGVMVTNGLPTMSKQVFSLVQDFTPPVFVLFFVFIGAKLNLESVSPLLLTLVGIYIVGRTFGKMSGAWCGAVLSGADAVIRKYLPLCLFSQAGVAVGLSLVAAQSLESDLGDAIVIIITVSTFIVQLVGPPCVKFAIFRAGEAGRNITEEDIIRSASARDLMDPAYPVIREDMPAVQVLEVFSSSPYTQYPVVDANGKLSGVINIDGIKSSLLFDRMERILLAVDLEERFEHVVGAESSLFEVKQYMDNFFLGFLPVADKDGVIIGGFDRRMYKKFVSAKLLEKK